MKIGFYFNGNSEVVLCGNRKKEDPEGLTWVDGHEDEFPEELKDLGMFTSLWDGNNIVDNPAYTSAKTADDSRVEGIKTGMSSSGLLGITEAEAEALIDSEITGTTVATVRDQTKAFLKKIMPFILNSQNIE